MSTLLHDLRYALRSLGRQPGFSIIVVITVALGVGANTAMFSVVHGVLLRPLPYDDPDALVRVYQSDRFNNTQREGVSGPDYFDYLQQQSVFAGMAAWTGLNPTLADAVSLPERLAAAQVTHTLLPTLGVRTALGRGFRPDDDTPGGQNVAILSHGLWLRRFGADSTIVGRPIRLDGAAYIVVGVLPAHFQFLPATDVWLPLQYGPTSGDRGMHNLGVIGRLDDGANIDMARAEMSRMMANLEELYPEDNIGRGATVDALSDSLTGNVRPALLLLMGAVLLVLLITCANVANMLLARGTARRREVAVRSAIGAGRGRIASQLLTESLVLAVAGGALGVFLAFAGVRLLMALEPANLPRLSEVSLSPPVLGFALFATVATGIVFGLFPTLQASRTNLNDALSEGARGSTGVGTGTVRSALVVTQVGFAFVLAAGAGLLIESMWNLTRVDPGFRYQHLVTLSVNLPQNRYPNAFQDWPEAPEIKQFYARALERAERIPSVTGAALALNHPVNPGWTTRIALEGGPATVEEGVEEERIRPITPGYFATIGTPLLRGRDFSEFDRGKSPAVVIVNDAFVRKYFPTAPPIGKRLQFWGVTREIVGVVADVRFTGMNAPPEPAVYAPMSQLPFSTFSVVIRGDAAPEQILRAMRGEIRQIDSELAVFAGQSLEALLATALGQQRFNMILLGLFAALALGLAAVGIYGVVSYGVIRRAHEFGVRMSLGADRANVSRLVLSQAVRMAVVGVGLGIIGVVAASRLMAGLLFGVGPTDPMTLGGVALFLCIVAIAAALIPAVRASRVEPVMALRQE
jgi:putative ABC transport system permease protein